jgi:hypothetical protein
VDTVTKLQSLLDGPLPTPEEVVGQVDGKIVSDGSSTDYYKIPEGAIDLLDLIEFKNMSFGVGNIFKACYRLGEKSGTDEAYDLRKIIFFAQRRLAKLEGTK